MLVSTKEVLRSQSRDDVEKRCVQSRIDVWQAQLRWQKPLGKNDAVQPYIFVFRG